MIKLKISTYTFKDFIDILNQIIDFHSFIWYSGFKKPFGLIISMQKNQKHM